MNEQSKSTASAEELAERMYRVLLLTEKSFPTDNMTEIEEYESAMITNRYIDLRNKVGFADADRIARTEYYQRCITEATAELRKDRDFWWGVCDKVNDILDADQNATAEEHIEDAVKRILGEREQLRRELEEAQAIADDHAIYAGEVKAENARLTAEVERLKRECFTEVPADDIVIIATLDGHTEEFSFADIDSNGIMLNEKSAKGILLAAQGLVNPDVKISIRKASRGKDGANAKA